MPTLNWLTKKPDLKAVADTPYRLLVEGEKYGYGDPDSGNLIVHGDNLEALKALLPFYAGQVKCIYIDPPYNTGSAFEHYDDNMEHTLWLSMMYPRLELLKQFLREDGVLFLQLDDNEHAYAKVICDEIFGRNNLVANIVWRSSDNSNNDAKQFSLDHNYILVYSKKTNWVTNKLPRRTTQSSHYSNPNNDPRGPWFDGNPISSPNPRPNLCYNIITPNGKKIKPPAYGWRWSEETLRKKMETGEIFFNNDFTNIKRKTYLYEQRDVPPSTLWAELEETGHNRQAKYEQKKLFPDRTKLEWFDTPKPEKLLQVILIISTNPGDLVLDSFLGSGTTVAVAHKMGRRYIGVEMGEQAKTHCAARLKKVIDGEQGGISEAVGWKGGGGFRFFTLGEAVFDSERRIKGDISFENLAAHIFFTETKTPMKKPKKKSAFLGIYKDTAYALLYNGILGDKSPSGGNVLTHTTLNHIMNSIDAVSKKKGENLSFNRLVIYGEATRLPHAAVKSNSIVFKQIPYEIKVW